MVCMTVTTFLRVPEAQPETWASTKRIHILSCTEQSRRTDLIKLENDPKDFAAKKMMKQLTSVIVVFVCFSSLLNVIGMVDAKPPKKDKIHSARWLVASSDWGVMATNRWGGKIFTNVISYSDGPYSQTERSNSTGVPYFFMSTLDETARDLEKDPAASFSISEKAADVDGRCGAIDAQEPTCARITLMGKIVQVKGKLEEAFAKKALFSKHPAMERWPSGHRFFLYKMDISEIFFLNDYGGASAMKLSDYMSARLVNDEYVQDNVDDDTYSDVVIAEARVFIVWV